MSLQTIVPISDSSQIGEARRQINRIADECGFSESDRGKAAIVISELAVNLDRYASGGEILIQPMQSATNVWIDILSIDRGPGIDNVERCLRDGYSTGGTPGNGLGAAKRMSNEFEIYSAQPGGTIVFCRILASTALSDPRPTFNWAVISRPMIYETECGDGWRIFKHDDRLAIMLVDGLGHGPEAAKAANEAAVAFDREPLAELQSLFNLAHARMHGTRGGALAAAHLDATTCKLKYLGIGNIAGHLRSENGHPGRSLFSHNGIVGLQMHRLQQFDYDWAGDGLLIMHSDGLQTRWVLDKYPGLRHSHPAVVAGVLYRDFIRGRDDVTIAVVRVHSNRDSA